MKSSLLAAAIGAASIAALALGCSSGSKSATSPTASYAWAGSWQIGWLNLPAGTSMTPANDTLTIAQNGSSYTGSYRDFTYVVTSNLYFVYTDVLSTASFAVTGDSLKLNAGDATDPYACVLTLTGTISGTTMQGKAAQGGPSPCPTASWSWAATRI